MDLTYKKPIKSFTELEAWREGHKFVLLVYKAVKNFPREERFGLANQIVRASVSITGNIAEGFSRKGSKEKIQFYYTAMGSLTEVQNQLLIARDIHYIDSQMFRELAERSVVVSKLLRGLIKSAGKM